jgi:4-hydroxybenzoate polyprenyltransferase
MSARDERRDTWAVLRVPQWIHFVSLPAAGVAHLDELHGERLLHVAGAMGICGCSLAYAYGLNAIYDRHADRDVRKNALAGRAKVPTRVVASVTCAGVSALLGAALLGVNAFAWVAISLLASTIYSAGPRLKRFPGAGLFGNLLIFLPLLFMAVDPRSAPGSIRLLVAVFALLLTQNQLLHEEGDAAEDADAGDTTTARWLGPRAVRWAIAVLGAGVVAAGAFAPTALAAGLCLAGGLASAVVGLTVRPARVGRLAHRYVSATIGVALFLTSAG